MPLFSDELIEMRDIQERLAKLNIKLDGDTRLVVNAMIDVLNASVKDGQPRMKVRGLMSMVKSMLEKLIAKLEAQENPKTDVSSQAIRYVPEYRPE
jgi:hypothetical protein